MRSDLYKTCMAYTNQSIIFYLQEQKLRTPVNIRTNIAGYQKAIELIELVTHCKKNMNTHYRFTNLT